MADATQEKKNSFGKAFEIFDIKIQAAAISSEKDTG